MRKIDCEVCTARVAGSVCELPLDTLADLRRAGTITLYRPNQILFGEGNPGDGEEAIFRLTLEPQTIEPRAILAAGGLENIEMGMARLAFLYGKQVREYLHRLEVAGLDRTPHVTIPLELPTAVLAA
jgi:hypothetical protein